MRGKSKKMNELLSFRVGAVREVGVMFNKYLELVEGIFVHA